MSDTGYSVVPRWILKDERFSGKMVATYLALQSFSGKDGVVFPSMPTLATRARLSESSVRRAIKELAALGVVVVTPRYAPDGGMTSNSYVLYTHAPGSEAPPPTNVTGDPFQPDTPLASEGHPKEPHVTNPIEVVTANAVTRAREENAFDQFWSIYPRRAGKVAARKAWGTAIKRALPADIIAGALRYRDDPNRNETFTAHPSTWLNQGRWDDDPLPSRMGELPVRMAPIDRAAADYNRLFGGADGHQRSISTLGASRREGWEDGFGAVGRGVG